MGKETNRDKAPEHNQATSAGISEGFSAMGAFESLEKPPKLLDTSLKLGSIGYFPKLHVLDGDDFEMIKQNINDNKSSGLGLIEQPPIFIKPQSNRKIIKIIR
jgi:hypothetical protein